MKRPTLVIMVKEPLPGRVKTRLGRDIGMVASAWWFRHQTRRLIKRLQDPRWDILLAVAPDYAGRKSRFFPTLPRAGQGRGDLGRRMVRFLRHVPGPVCLIGGDIPGVERPHIARAFAELGSKDIVLGPAPDGGFWLIGTNGQRALVRDVFDGVKWSATDTLVSCLACVSDRRVGFVDILSDVDTVDDLHALQRGLSAPPPKVILKR